MINLEIVSSLFCQLKVPVEWKKDKLKFHRLVTEIVPAARSSLVKLLRKIGLRFRVEKASISQTDARSRLMSSRFDNRIFHVEVLLMVSSEIVEKSCRTLL